MPTNFQLANSDGDTWPLHVINVGSMFDFNNRMRLAGTSQSSTTRIEGDGVDVVVPMTFTCRLTADSESEVGVSINRIIIFLSDGNEIRRVTSGRQNYYRALPKPCLQSAIATPLNARRDDWALQLTLLPRFPRWTETSVTTLAGYQAATKL